MSASDVWRAAALHKLPEAKVTEGVSIDDFSTWRAVRFAEPPTVSWLPQSLRGRERMGRTDWEEA